MCLRYALETVEFAALRARFGVENAPKLVSRWNIAPTQKVPAVLASAPNELSMPSWGMPRQGKQAEGFHFNARAETVAELPSFADSFQERRCLMIADSFYEWKKPNNDPFRLRLIGEDKLFAFAGIYNDAGCCMITVPPNKLVSQVHDRMPAILDKKDEKDYLKLTAKEALELLKPYPAEKMEMDALSREINSSKSEGKGLVRVLKKEEGLAGWQ